jgi:hypothetical protein
MSKPLVIKKDAVNIVPLDALGYYLERWSHVPYASMSLLRWIVCPLTAALKAHLKEPLT